MITTTKYANVCPYLIVNSVESQIEFMVKVFNAEVKEDKKQPDGFINHGEVVIDNVIIMMGRASSSFPSKQGMNYIYVNDPDEVYAKAISHGAVSIMEPVNQAYGNRSGGFIDPEGNEWWVARPL